MPAMRASLPRDGWQSERGCLIAQLHVPFTKEKYSMIYRHLSLAASAAALCFAANVAQAQQSPSNMPAMSANAASMPGRVANTASG